MAPNAGCTSCVARGYRAGTMSEDLSNAPIFAATAAPSPSREFEFGAAENEVFTRLAGSMRFVGTASIALAVLTILSAAASGATGGMRALPFIVGESVGAAVMVVMGVWLRGASQSIAAIVSTEGRDVAHLMRAMGDLARMFLLQRTIFIVAFVVFALAIVASILVATLLPPGLLQVG